MIVWLLIWAIAGAPAFHASSGWGIALIVLIILNELAGSR